MKFRILLVACALASMTVLQGQSRLSTENGRISFKSDAPLELIEAASGELKGIIDPSRNAFAFSVNIQSFQGFNSPLQREHFNENYMESKKFPRATFSGKFIEDVDFTKDGAYQVRAKGKLNVHGIEKERIIKGSVKVEGGKVTLTAAFTVLLEEHGIAIPKIVYQKIAEEISVELVATLTAQEG
ncbi:MAG: YceI family protein [Lewinellaceae bacterium]|nr:YceI family protein [Lewinella sp.]MCB9282200.1 YceI family protein [Lewinellaceae bacterium]